MKEIGEKLKNARESMGISVEEAAQDLNINSNQLENIELGKKEEFKDVFYLKNIIKEYSKYLGLDYDEMVEEFNEFLFDFTSKISLDDIKKAEKEQKKKEKNLKTIKIVSPYTSEKNSEKQIPTFLLVGAIVIFVIIIVYICVFFFTKDKREISNTIANKGVELNEFA